MANLLQKASIVLTPTAYDNGKVLCAKPSEAPYGDFDFSRNSAATRVNAQGLVENVQILSGNLVQNGDFSEEGAEEVSNGSFSQEGAELVTNGDFATDTDWSKGTGWSISGGTANCDGTQTSGTNLIQNFLALGTNKIFKIEFELKDYQAGKLIYVNLTGTGILEFENINANGTYVAYSGLSTGDNFITFRADADFIGSIDNVSVREVGQDWTLGAGWSIGEDKAISDGTTSNLDQFNTSIIGKSYKVSVTVSDITTGALSVRLGSTSGSEVINITSNGTYVAYGVAETTYLRLRSQSGFDGSVTNISVKEVGQNWVISDGWYIGDNLINIDTTLGTENLQQANVFTIGRKYKITLDANITSGSVKFESGSGSNLVITSSDTNVEHIFEADLVNIVFRRNVVGTQGTLTNISVIEITDDTNLPRINYEGFSYQDALGSELVTNGDFATDLSGWTNITNVTWSSNFGGSAFMNAVGTNAQFRQTISYEVGKTYRISWEVKENNGCDFFRVYNNNSYTNITDNYIGTHYFDFTHTSGLSFILRNDRVGSDITIDNVSVKEYLGQEVVPDSGCGSWLFEPQSTNLIPYSEDYNSGNWYEYNETSATIDASQSNPSGANGSYKIESLSGLGRFGLSAITVAPSTNYTLSFYVKNINATLLKVVLGSGASPGSYTYTSDVNTSDWSRVSVNFTTGAVTSMQIQFLRDLPVGESAYIWGAMLEQNSFSTSYIPTSGSQVTRNQDVCTNGGSLATINSTEGTLYFEGAALSNDGTNRIISLSNGNSISNSIRIYYSTLSSYVYFQKYVNGVRTTNLATTSVTKTDFNKIAIRYNSTDVSVFVNGVNVLNNADANVFAPNTLNSFDFSQSGTILPFFGKTKAVAVWKEALTDSELQSLTTI